MNKIYLYINPSKNMRQVISIVIAFVTINAFGQITPVKVPLVSRNTQPKSLNDNKVSYVGSNNSESPACYLNGQLLSETILKTLNPEEIESIHVSHQETVVDSQKYHGQIFIVTKREYVPNLISLNGLKSKYIYLKNEPTIFMINDEIIKEDYDKCKVDENYLLNISIQKIDIDKEKLHFNFIKILTKTEENIKKSKEIYIRGLYVIK
jgi:hypothetical protein